MASSTGTAALFLPILLIFTVAEGSFRCTSPPATTCTALIGYVSPNATTISAIQALFTVKNLRSILGANNLPVSTPRNHSIAANETVKIPFPCTCRNGTRGSSDGHPTYTVIPGDGLFHIATEVFSGLVTVEDIQVANNISNPELILVGQILQIPLPCSCDDVDGQKVVHYGHVVAPGSSVEAIALQFNTSQETLLRLNNLNDSKNLLAGAVLDVPLRTCSSVVNNNSLDYPLLVPNGTYVFTATSCVRCKCDATVNWMLDCQPASSAHANASCPPIQCEGAGNLSLGNMTFSGCNRTTCAYAGYNQRILTALVSDTTTCPVNSDNKSSAVGLGLGQWSWNATIVFVHMLLLLRWRSMCQ